MATSTQTRLKFESMIFRVIFSKAVKLASSRYITALEKVRKQKDDDVVSKKQKLVDDEITLMKRK